jgi:hypothetical protein
MTDKSLWRGVLMVALSVVLAQPAEARAGGENSEHGDDRGRNRGDCGGRGSGHRGGYSRIV